MLHKYSFIAVWLLLAAATEFAATTDVSSNIIHLREGQEYTNLMNPGYPEIYTGGETLTWRFQSETDNHVYMKCKDFRLNKKKMCKTIRLQIDNGKTQVNYCGKHRGLNVVSTGNELTVKLIGDKNGKAAFSCIVTSVRSNDDEEIELQVNEVYQVISPRRASPYLNKVWHLKTSLDKEIHVSCSIDLIKSDPCVEDVLTVTLNDDQPKQFCGYKKDLTFKNTNEITITLKLNGKGAGKILCLARAAVKQKKSLMQNTGRFFFDEDSSEYGTGNGERNTTCKCGWTNKPPARIINGNKASPNEFPWMAYVEVDQGTKLSTCGGSIISRRHILTAAHCIVDILGDLRPVSAEGVKVIVGGHNLSFGPPWKGHKTHYAEELYVRREFPMATTHDIGIIVVAEPIEYTQKVGPVCLSPISLNVADEVLTIMGWGRTEGNEVSTVLLKAKTSIIDSNMCGASYWEVCTRADQSATCTGDSGGPLVWLDPDTNRYTQVSLVSYGHEDCVSSPTVSTDVAYFYKWIHHIIKATYPQATTCTKVV